MPVNFYPIFSRMSKSIFRRYCLMCTKLNDLCKVISIKENIITRIFINPFSYNDFLYIINKVEHKADKYILINAIQDVQTCFLYTNNRYIYGKNNKKLSKIFPKKPPITKNYISEKATVKILKNMIGEEIENSRSSRRTLHFRREINNDNLGYIFTDINYTDISTEWINIMGFCLFNPDVEHEVINIGDIHNSPYTFDDGPIIEENRLLHVPILQEYTSNRYQTWSDGQVVHRVERNVEHLDLSDNIIDDSRNYYIACINTRSGNSINIQNILLLFPLVDIFCLQDFGPISKHNFLEPGYFPGHFDLYYPNSLIQRGIHSIYTCILVRKNFGHLVTQRQSKDIETIIQIKDIQTNNKIGIINFYRPPRDPYFYRTTGYNIVDYSESIAETISTYSNQNYIFMGDFNLDFDSPRSNHFNELNMVENILPSLNNHHNAIPGITTYKSTSNGGTSSVDSVWVPNDIFPIYPDNVSVLDETILWPTLSDHFGIEMVISLTNTNDTSDKKARKKIITYDKSGNFTYSYIDMLNPSHQSFSWIDSFLDDMTSEAVVEHFPKLIYNMNNLI